MTALPSMAQELAEHLRVVAAAETQLPVLQQMAERIAACFAAGGKLYIFGNGGSAADAQHIAAELIGRFKHDRPPLPGVALTTDTSVLTAIANDTDAVHAFERQVQALVTERDAVWALSVSGTSPNVVRALQVAQERNCLRIAFTGRRGESLRELCDLVFVADHNDSDRVQEVHQLAYHLVCERLERTALTPSPQT